MTKFLQINLGRGREAQDLLMQAAGEKRTDVLIVSEQYRKPDTGVWFEDTTGRAAIAVLNSNMTIGEVSKPTADFVWAAIDGVRVYSCYFSPNIDYEDFLIQLDRLEDSIRTADSEVLVAGDLNSKSPEWGSRRLDNRGEALSELIARLDLSILNEGNLFTFRRGQTGSVVDVTLATAGIAARTEGWKVLEDATLSDHQYLEFRVNRVPSGSQEQTGSGTTRESGWVLRRLNRTRMTEVLEMAKRQGTLQRFAEDGNPDSVVTYAVEKITEACDAAMPKRKKHPGARRTVYWWNTEISELRKKCTAARRAAQRRRRRGDAPTTEILQSHFKAARKKLRAAIKTSKKRSWVELCRTIEDDPWGLPYKIVTKKLGGRQPIPGLSCPARMMEIVTTLFPAHDRRLAESAHGENPGVVPLTIEEIHEAKKRLQPGKAPGPDNIPNEIIGVVVEVWPELLLEAYNTCLHSGVFPEKWKRQKLVLLRKGDKPLDEPSSYRPICLLDNMGKLFERLLLQRLEKHIESNGGLSERQYGFRKGRSTVDAIARVIDAAERIKQGTWKTKGFCALVTLDVKNAFNSARWDVITNALAKRQAPRYLRKMIGSYLTDRKLIYDTEDGPMEYEVTAGVPQGSVLGPFLWNVMYDGLLNLELPDGATIVGFADDVAVVVTARTAGTLEILTNETLRRASKWLKDNGLQLAVHKTEAVLITDKRIFETPNIVLEGQIIQWSRAVRYLGVQVDNGLRYVEHVIKVTNKAAKTAAALARLMPNIGGPREAKKRLLSSVVHAQILYGAEIWAAAADKVAAKRKLASVQRRSAVRVISGYRTVSEGAALVLASTPPIDLLIHEKQEIYEELSQHHQRQERERSKEGVKQQARQRLMERWQTRWDTDTSGRWTHKLIPDVVQWCSRTHGEMGYHLTQALTGHGCFNTYLERFKKTDSAACLQCGQIPDDARHTIFECPGTRNDRSNMTEMLEGIELTEENFMQVMLTSERSWEVVKSSITGIMKKKEEAEREWKALNAAFDEPELARNP